jgi:hypothetical protein
MRVTVNDVCTFFEVIGTKLAIEAKCGHGACRDALEAFEEIRRFVADPS